MKKKRTIARQAEGLHIWEVTHSEDENHLWITTPTRSPKRAIEKAEKFIDQNQRGSKIMNLQYQGTIDA